MVSIARQFQMFWGAHFCGVPTARCCALTELWVSGTSQVSRSRGVVPWGALILACLLSVSSSLTHAQSDPEQSFSPGNSLTPLPDVLSEGTLQPKARLWLSDRDGNQILVPEETAEDYFSARSQAGGGMGLPPAVLKQVEVEANVQGAVAHLTGSFSVVLSQDFATTINLAFGSVQLSQSSFTGEASQNRLQTSRDDPGWRWILLGEANTTHTATLTGVSRIASDQERRSLRISLPSAPCKLHVTLPGTAEDLRVRNDDVLQRRESAGEVVEVEVNCRGGEFTLSWRERADLPQVAAIVATSTTRFEVVDPTGPWSATTTLNIRWHGRDAASQLRIELPAGGEWGALPNSDPERYMILGQDDSLPLTTADTATGDTATGDTANGDTTNGDTTNGDTTNGEAAAQVTPVAMTLLLENFDVTRNDALTIELEWDWVPTSVQSNSGAMEVKLKTPLLHGVDQHTGIIDCVVTSAYAVVFNEGDGAQLVHQAPLMDPFARHQLQFKFDRQAFDLDITFRREQVLPTIRPTYLVNVDRNKLTLTMWFDCSFDTNQPQMELGLVLDEWIIQENTARMVSDPKDLFSAEGDVLRVMQQVDRNYVIRSAGGASNNFGGSRHVDQTWRVVAERAWSPEDHELYFQVPRIIRGRVNGNPEIDHGSGALLVTNASNVLLTWQETAGTGLQRDSFSTEYQRYASQTGARKPMVYRFQSSETTPRWAGSAELLPRQVTVEQALEIGVGGTQISIAQNFGLQVANEALGELRFAVRKDAAESQPPQVLIDGQLVSTRLLADISERELEEQLLANGDQEFQSPIEVTASGSGPIGSDSVWQTYQTLGSPGLLGASQVQIRSQVNWKPNPHGRTFDQSEPVRDPRPGTPEEVPPASMSEAEATQVEVPLAQLLLPSGSRRTRQTWTLRTDPQVEAMASAGLAADSPSNGQRAGNLDLARRVLQFDLRPRRLLGTARVRLEVSWLQTFVNDQKRRERFVARVVTSSDELQLKLPQAANIRAGDECKVSVNGLRRDYKYDQPTDIVIVPLNGGEEQTYVVEVSYFLPDSLSWLSFFNVSPPEILGAENAEQFYWQVLTPSVNHLGWSPSELTAEWVWQWSGWCWKRTSQLNQRQLEELIGARPQEPPPASANSYVMSGRGVSGSANAWILSRFILWIPVGLLAIMISFAALNYPFVRRPGFVFGLAIILAGLATLWPDLAALAGQTALLSLGLVVMVWVSQAAVDSRVRRRSVFSARPSTYVERSDHFSVARSGRASPPPQLHGSSRGTSGG